MQQALFVAFGGALGALTRYGVARVAIRMGYVQFPVGTWVANLAGCFLIGLALPWLAHGQTRLYALLVVGYLGAFTTFSTFSLDTVLLMENGKAGLALLNLVAPVLVGVVLVWLGLLAGRALGAPTP